ncbi:hypothetical protein B0I27_101587 [Arcticibacter pallidicorallinus]|uniref:Uncharacterized protein n=1 Tax=Arcticibacter pallidicorallinus TaxID=1259464 RepID=A0A2T0UCG3_9SPHI|nr:hypothetical protein [Arcticibacter pallidicorallinus]PRY55613.1 hypothetical protein B0I27_101587 [Arcticibacter pallidicorallinus]
MENLSPNESPGSINFNDSCFRQLDVTRKWTRFLSVVGFVFLVFMAVFFLVALTQFFGGGNWFQVLTIVPLVLMGAVYFFPIYFLSKFSYHSKLALNTFSGESLATALRYLKLHYVYMGVLLIIVIFGYLVAFVGMMTMSGLDVSDVLKTPSMY